jgi:hypothetical protein
MDDIDARIQTLNRRLALLERRTADETAAIRAELATLRGRPANLRTPSAPAARTQRDLSWLAGPTGLAIAGGVVTLLGIVFVFALAASRGWIGPAVRCSIGGGVSLVLLALALEIRRRFGHLVAALAAAGVGIGGLYVTLYAASRGYHLVGATSVWAGVVVVAALAVALALAWETELLAVLGLAAVVIAPPTVEGHLIALGLGASAVAATAAMGLGALRRWRALGGVSYTLLWAQTAVYVVEARDGFFGERGNDVGTWHHRAAATGLAITVVVLALAGVAAYGRGRRALDGFTSLLAASTLPFSLLAVWALLESSGERGDALLALAAVYALAAAATFRLAERDLGVLLLAFGFCSCALATAFLLSNGGLVIAWTLEGLTLLAVARAVKRPTFQAAGLVYLAAAVVHVLAFETPFPRLFTEHRDPAQHVVLLLLLVGALGAGAVLLHGRPLLLERLDLAATGSAVLLAIYAGSLALLELSQTLGGGELHARFQRGETMVSTLWAVVALAVLTAGLTRALKELRYAGLSLLSLALAKLFLFDLSQLSSLTRAASFLAVGLTLLAGGLLVQRLAHPREVRT